MGSAAAIGPDGTLYFGAGSTVAGNDARLFAHDSRTGEKKWEIVVGTGYSANNAVALGAEGVLLGWGEAAELETDIFCWYTLARKLPAGQAPAAPTR